MKSSNQIQDEEGVKYIKRGRGFRSDDSYRTSVRQRYKGVDPHERYVPSPQRASIENIRTQQGNGSRQNMEFGRSGNEFQNYQRSNSARFSHQGHCPESNIYLKFEAKFENSKYQQIPNSKKFENSRNFEDSKNERLNSKESRDSNTKSLGDSKKLQNTNLKDFDTWNSKSFKDTNSEDLENSKKFKNSNLEKYEHSRKLDTNSKKVEDSSFKECDNLNSKKFGNSNSNMNMKTKDLTTMSRWSSSSLEKDTCNNSTHQTIAHKNSRFDSRSPLKNYSFENSKRDGRSETHSKSPRRNYPSVEKTSTNELLAHKNSQFRSRSPRKNYSPVEKTRFRSRSPRGKYSPVEKTRFRSRSPRGKYSAEKTSMNELKSYELEPKWTNENSQFRTRSPIRKDSKLRNDLKVKYDNVKSHSAVSKQTNRNSRSRTSSRHRRSYSRDSRYSRSYSRDSRTYFRRKPYTRHLRSYSRDSRKKSYSNVKYPNLPNSNEVFSEFGPLPGNIANKNLPQVGFEPVPLSIDNEQQQKFLLARIQEAVKMRVNNPVNTVNLVGSVRNSIIDQPGTVPKRRGLKRTVNTDQPVFMPISNAAISLVNKDGQPEMKPPLPSYPRPDSH